MTKRFLSTLSLMALAVVVAGCAPASVGESQPISPVSESTEAVLSSELCGGAPMYVDEEPLELVVAPGSGLNSEPYLLWGIEQDCFERYGLKIINSPNPSQADRNAALIGGSVDVAMSVTTNLIQAPANAGLNLKIVAPIYSLSSNGWDEARRARSVDGQLLQNTALLVNPDLGVETVQDLRGLRIGSISYTGPNGLGLYRALEEAGIGRDEISAISMSTELQIAAFQNGELDGVIVSGADVANLMASGAQFVLYPSVQFLQPGTALVWVTVPDTVENKSEELSRFREAVRATNSLLSTQKGLEDFKGFLVEQYGLSEADTELTAFPEFPVADVDPAEFGYLVDELLSEGQIEQRVDVAELSLIF